MQRNQKKKKKKKKKKKIIMSFYTRIVPVNHGLVSLYGCNSV